MNEFPLNCGFKYNDEYDEWQKPQFNGVLILFEKLNEYDVWELSFLDEEDYLHTITKGDEDYIITQIKMMDRDNKINEILGHNKQS